MATRISRRGFLKRAGAVVGAASVGPMIVPASALGLGGAPAPSERINIGLIGVGKQMRGHHGAMLGRAGVQVLALCDVEAVRLERERARNNEHYAAQSGAAGYNGCKAFKDFRELVALADIDAVMVATPDHWHALASVEALRAGKDVYCEKPMAHTVREGQAMRDTTRRFGRVFQTGSQQRSSEEFRRACEIVRNGRIGRVHTVHVNVSGPPVECRLPGQPVPEGLDWDFWLGPAPERPYNADIAPGVDFDGWPNWRAYSDYGGGGMADWGAHHFDIAQWGLGMDESGPIDLLPPDPDNGVKYLTYIYENGTVMYHGGATPERAGVEFIGTEGRVMVNRGWFETDPVSLKDEPLGRDDVHLYKSEDHHEDWLNAIKTRQRPICDVAIGQSSATICNIGNIAYALKRPLKWDPKREEFRDDAEANRLLARPMRGTWTI